MKARLKIIAAAMVIALIFSKALAETNFMVFMLGGDLEENDGAATQDILEMLRVTLDTDARIYVLAGGARSWSLSEAEGGASTILFIRDDNIAPLDRQYLYSAATTECLSWFLTTCGAAKPSENILVLWGHGLEGGGGIGYDTCFGEDVLMIEEIASAIDESGVDIDLIGFDACYMATENTEAALRDRCKHLLAAQSETPKSGWPYHRILNEIRGDPEADCERILDIVNEDFMRRDEPVKLILLH